MAVKQDMKAYGPLFSLPFRAVSVVIWQKYLFTLRQKILLVREIIRHFSETTTYVCEITRCNAKIYFIYEIYFFSATRRDYAYASIQYCILSNQELKHRKSATV